MIGLGALSVLSRRRVLRVALAAGVAVAGAAAGLVGLRGCSPSVSGLRCLSDHEYRTLFRLADALFPPGGAFPPGAAEMDLARVFDGFLADEPDDVRSDLRRALLWLEYGPVVHDRRPRTFSNLPDDERLDHFERWATSADAVRRQVAVALRRFLTMAFYDRPEVWPHVGWDGPLVQPPAKP